MTEPMDGGGFAGWRPLGLALLWTAVFVGLSLGGAVLFFLVVSLAVRGNLSSIDAWLSALGPGQLLVQGLVTIAAGALATILVARWTRLGWQDLRWRRVGSVVRTVPAGFLFGAVPAALTIVLVGTVGGATWVAVPGTPLQLLGAAGLIFGTLLPAAMAVELLFRGVPLVLLGRALGFGSAVVVVAVAFGAAHLGTPGVSALAVANIALAGVLLGTVFLGPGGFWAATAAHWGWNATLALAGASVSGIPFQLPLYRYRPGGPLWLTGGPFGPEGGLAATFALGVAVLVAARRAGRRPA